MLFWYRLLGIELVSGWLADDKKFGAALYRGQPQTVSNVIILLASSPPAGD